MSKIALVTGASSGIGKACALALLKEGWTVVLVGRRADALQATTAESGSALAVPMPADLTQEDQVKALFAQVEQRFGRLDLLFNNAGISIPYTLPSDMSGETWRSAVDINLNAAFYCLSHAFAVMKKQSPQGGRIINNGSISAQTPRPGSVAYTATKHAMTGLTKTAALDGRAWNIAVGQIDIGNAASEITTAMSAGIRQADGTLQSEPVMDVQHAANAVLHMANLPPEANVLFMTVMATKMPFVGRG